MNRRLYAGLTAWWAQSFARKAICGSAPYRLGAWFFAEPHAKIAAHKVVYLLFLCGVLLVPWQLWRNAILLGSAAVFAFIFAAARALEPDDTRPAPPKFIYPGLALFVGFCALSIFTGYGGSDSARVFSIFLACVVHSVLIAHTVSSYAAMRLFCKLAACTLGLLALFGFYQLAVGIPIRPEMTDLAASPGLVRLHSTLGGNPNNDAQAWGMLLPFGLALLVAARCDTKRVVLAGFAALCVAAFALTFSRAGYVAAMAGVGVFVLMSAPRLVPLAIIAGLLMLPFVPEAIMARLFTLGTDESSLYRFNIWRGVVNMLRTYWVQGIGMGPVAFAQTYARHYHGEAWRALHAHNTFLDIFVHSGIGALVTFTAYIFGLIKRGIAAHMNAPSKETKMFTAAAVASVVVFLAFGVGEYVWFYPRVMLVSWASFGVLAAAGGGLPSLGAERD